MNLPDSTRLWIYQSNRVLNDYEVDEIKSEAEEFISTWQSHGTDLVAHFDLLHNTFLIFFVNQEYCNASGCSIDKSVNFIKKIEEKYGLDLFDRMNLAFEINGKIEFIKFPQVESKLTEGKLTADNTFYDNSITNYKEFKNKWKTTIKNSWIAERVLTKAT